MIRILFVFIFLPHSAKNVPYQENLLRAVIEHFDISALFTKSIFSLADQVLFKPFELYAALLLS